MHFDFIEIGTSDFDTLTETADKETGLCIEPVECYLANVPERVNVFKLQAAISNFCGRSKVYYVAPEDIARYNLPWWIRGCNSVGKPHPTVKKFFGERHDENIKIDAIPVYNWEFLVASYNVTSINTIKIDAEGSDHIVVRDYFELCADNQSLYADRILFEHNELSNKEDIQLIIGTASSEYNIALMPDDILLVRKGRQSAQ